MAALRKQGWMHVIAGQKEERRNLQLRGALGSK
jgi:hypothetical protein